jgi:amino acid transporter
MDEPAVAAELGADGVSSLPADGDAGLRRGSLSQADVLAQSVAQIAPSAIVGSEIALIVAIAGPASWVAWTLGIIVYVLVGFALSRLALRFSSTGGLYSLARRASGPTGAYIVGVGMIIGYLVTAPALVFQFAEFTAGYLHLNAFGIADTHVTALVVGSVGLVGAGWCAYSGVVLAARTMLIAEIASMSAIVILLVIILFTHHGSIFSHALLSLHGVSLHTLLLASPLVLFAAAGFETSAVLGEEAAKPRRAIPLAMLGSIVVVGVFLICCSYVLVLAFQGSHSNIADSANALSGAASLSGVSWYAYVVGLGVIISMFSVMIAIYNSAARLLYTLSRERVMPTMFGYSHPKYRTPSKGILAIGAANLVALLIVVAAGWNVLNAFGDLATLSGYGLALMYIGALAAVALFFGRRLRERGSALQAGVAVVAIIPLGYVFYTFFHPLPPYPIDVYLWIFIGLLAAAAAVYLWLRLRARHILNRIGALTVATAVDDIHPRDAGGEPVNGGGS